MANLWESFKKLLGAGDDGGPDAKRPVWKKLNTMMLVAAGGILLIVLANAFSAGVDSPAEPNGVGPAEQTRDVQTVTNDSADIVTHEDILGKKLEKVLTQIEGVGEVTVTINLASTPQKEYAVNTTINNKQTNENDQKGGTRTINEVGETGQMVMMRENQGSKEQPVVVKESKPEVKGVIVVAEGAEDPLIKSELIEAVYVYLEIPLHKVVVLSKESR